MNRVGSCRPWEELSFFVVLVGGGDFELRGKSWQCFNLTCI